MRSAPAETSGSLLSGAMLGIACGAILVPLNSTMLAVALPSVMGEFSVGPAEVASLVTLYLGAVAVALPASGSLGDRFGHRRTFLIGVVGFGLASLIAATAGSFAILALSRVLQAVSGALLSTSSAVLIRATAPPDRRGAAFGLFDMLVSTSAAIGPFIGGLLVGGLGWRTLFFVSVPVAVVAAIAVGAMSATARADHLGHVPRPIDLPGLALLAVLLVALLAAVNGLEGGGPGRWAALALPPLVLAFAWWELRSDHPAVDPRLFASRPFAAAVIGVMGATVVLHATFVLVPLLVQRLQGGAPTTSGLVLLGISALGAVAAPFGGRLSDRVGRRLPAVVGMAVCAVGLAALWRVAPEASAVLLGLLLAVVGFGMGLSGSPRQAAAFETVAPDRVGMAAGTYFTGRYLGGVFGASLAGSVLGGAVTAAGVSLGFGLIAIVTIVVVIASLGLPGAPRDTRVAAS
ncbi:MAG: MFS transporter [Chloroflexota bacterium]|nr:MFS transporter [Chloroflexota bacterium]